VSTTEQFSTDAAVKIYLPLMHELAIRTDLVAQACEGKLNLTPPYAREYAYLQFRRMCELIALGCLQLHDDLPLPKSAKKEWHADDIMTLLHRNHPHSFPQAIIREQTPEGWNIKANSKPNALTREEFKKLYNECGAVLHRGTIRSLEANDNFNEADYHKVNEWQGKIVDLMSEHLIGRSNGTGYYVVSLRTESGYPECSTFNINAAGEVMVSTLTMNVSNEVVHSYLANRQP
jgi:hypothetical protein